MGYNSTCYVFPTPVKIKAWLIYLFTLDLQVTLWDTGGLERYDSMTANYYRYCHAVLLVYDLSAEETLFFLADWFKEAKANSRWPQRIIFSLWGNKSDVSPDEQSVKEESVSAFLKQYNIPESLNFRVSAKSGDSVVEAFQKVVETVHDDFSTQSLLDLSTDRDLALLNPSIGSRSGLPPKRLKCCGR